MIGNRIKEIRTSLNLNQTDFGKRIGVKQSSVASYESGSRQPVDAVITSICREFSVNELWLRSGDGEPFKVARRDQQIESFINRILEDEPEGPKARLVAALAGLDEQGWDVLVDLAQKMVAENANTEMKEELKAAPSTDTPSVEVLTPDEQELLRQYRERKNQEGRSSASAAS